MEDGKALFFGVQSLAMLILRQYLHIYQHLSFKFLNHWCYPETVSFCLQAQISFQVIKKKFHLIFYYFPCMLNCSTGHLIRRFHICFWSFENHLASYYSKPIFFSFSFPNQHNFLDTSLHFLLQLFEVLVLFGFASYLIFIVLLQFYSP